MISQKQNRMIGIALGAIAVSLLTASIVIAVVNDKEVGTPTEFQTTFSRRTELPQLEKDILSSIPEGKDMSIHNLSLSFHGDDDLGYCYIDFYSKEQNGKIHDYQIQVTDTTSVLIEKKGNFNSEDYESHHPDLTDSLFQMMAKAEPTDFENTFELNDSSCFQEEYDNYVFEDNTFTPITSLPTEEIYVSVIREYYVGNNAVRSDCVYVK